MDNAEKRGVKQDWGRAVIFRWILHIEAHWGYRPIVKFQRAPRTGDITPWGVLILCPTCQDGHLAHDPRHSNLTNPMPLDGDN